MYHNSDHNTTVFLDVTLCLPVLSTPHLGRNDLQVKVKFTPEKTTRDQKGEERYSSTLSLTSVLDGVGGQGHVLAALPPVKTPGTHSIGG